MHSPPQEEIEGLFQQMRSGWRAEASSQLTPEGNESWYIKLYDEGGHIAGSARFAFADEPPRLEFINLDFRREYQRQGLFTALYPLLGPWLQRYGFEWIIIREWIDPAPFFARGFLERLDPAKSGDTVLAVDLTDPDRPSREWTVPKPSEPPSPDAPTHPSSIV